MKIYTGFGDRGKTRLFGGEVVDKDHPRVEVYGTLDELNSWIGLIINAESDQKVKKVLFNIQNDLFNISSLIASPTEQDRKKLKFGIKDINYQSIEKFIDEINEKLPPLKNFILPGGATLSSYYQISRTICRRAERNLVKIIKDNEVETEFIVYLNRLSDLLFVLARYANLNENIKEINWNSGS